jgi:hypothetical protein
MASELLGIVQQVYLRFRLWAANVCYKMAIVKVKQHSVVVGYGADTS